MVMMIDGPKHSCYFLSTTQTFHQVPCKLWHRRTRGQAPVSWTRHGAARATGDRATTELPLLRILDLGYDQYTKLTQLEHS